MTENLTFLLSSHICISLSIYSLKFETLSEFLSPK